MKIDVVAVRQCLQSFDFKTLFRVHLGWDNHQARIEFPADGDVARLTSVAQKQDFVAFICPTIFDRPARLKIEHQATKTARKHLVIYADKKGGRQVWHWACEERGGHLSSRELPFDTSQSGDLLIQRLDKINRYLEDKDQFVAADDAGRAGSAFDVQKITKKFCDRFKAERSALLELTKGIEIDADLQLYASLMLNRLMFLYFIQKKGFLDGDPDYLRHRFQMVQEARSGDNFQSFYRYFLLRLFHDRLAKSVYMRKPYPAMEKLLGKVPFLNGGFFEPHRIEEQNTDIDIQDDVFEKLFDFFDQYCWRLDERHPHAHNEINLNVLGYVFEKYVNQKQMSAYYTKEDITEYICKNTLIPFLFEAAAKNYPLSFGSDTGSPPVNHGQSTHATVWSLLSDDPDRYIYPSVKHGVINDDGSVLRESKLPDFVQTGMRHSAARMHDTRYNLQQAPFGDPFRLATETWREYGDRRTRCLDILEQLKNGEINRINDFIELNLDLWQFARDVIVTTEDPELLRTFFQAIEKVTVLDPTCGSGSYLLTALRLLESLYGDCMERMERFIEDYDGSTTVSPENRVQDGPATRPGKYSDFRTILAQIAKHPSEPYFVLKSIIINNLFGVDIMAEAVEICKLRLFLKLLAQVERVDRIEPLPDLNFNIRTGNTLIGYTTEGRARKAFTQDASGQMRAMDANSIAAYSRFEENVAIVDKAFRQVRTRQTLNGSELTYDDKQKLQLRPAQLASELDRYLAAEYGIAANKFKSEAAYYDAFASWRADHHPFHWFVEFYDIMLSGGFDVIIGNPPWKDYATVKKEYTVLDYYVEKCGNLYALCTEKALQLLTPGGYLGFIVQLPMVSSPRMATLRHHLAEQSRFVNVIPFDDRPGKLFDGFKNCRSAIFIARKKWQTSESDFLTTRYNRWATEVRDNLFSNLEFTRVDQTVLFQNQFPKIPSNQVASAFSKLFTEQRTPLQMTLSPRRTDHFITYQEATGYWVKATVRLMHDAKNREVGAPADNRRYFFFRNKETAHIACAVLNSSLFYTYFIAYGDCSHLNDEPAGSLPLPPTVLTDKSLAQLNEELMEDFERHASKKTIGTKNGEKTSYDEFQVSKSKAVIDEIDRVLARHYGFTDEELDAIINYDIKYRMGRDGSGRKG
ncbi:MAG: Eco57I restriction-modification methylase domain-containing protein [Syntrophobacteraceae bacterium]